MAQIRRRAPDDSTASVRPVHVRPGCSRALPSCCPVAAWLCPLCTVAGAPPPPGIVSRRAPSAPAREALALAHFGHLLLAFGELFSALLPRCRHHTPSGRPEPRGVAGGGNASTSLSGAPRAATACEQRARGGSVPAQSSRSIGFLMLVGSSLTLCGLIYNNNAMLSPSLLFEIWSLKVEFSFTGDQP